MRIETVDFARFAHGQAADRAAFVQALGHSFSEIGFAIVRNHGLNPAQVAAAAAAFEAFFALPEPVKMHYWVPGIAGQRGYTPRAMEHAKGRNTGDLKEFFHIGQIFDAPDPLQAIYPENVWVAEVPDVERFGSALYKALEATGGALLEAVALYLGLEQGYFTPRIRHGNSILRPIHYYPIEAPDSLPPDAVRAAEHEDINLITLLLGASAEGLEVLHRSGQWVPANPAPDEVVVNVGDMLQRLTHGRLRSTTHRVVNPPRERMHLPRFSMPFFLHPRPEMELTCLPGCVPPGEAPAYAPITAGAYLDERLREIGLK